ncbi:MAG: LapA family protein, partial [Gammaproteobacteria bacterium]
LFDHQTRISLRFIQATHTRRPARRRGTTSDVPQTVPNRFRRQDLRIISYFFLLVIILFGTTFATLNSESVTINYYFGLSTLPLSLLLVLVFALGCFIGMLVGFWMLIKSKLHNYRLRQRLHLAEKEIENLRAIPLQDKV